ncbi:L-threonylcarbamoyladenylate synthase [Simiduia aestuariiviva]|uniref:Threonylcarbamoyl-AMP synthase n=1 Tax=Simiduia aestuariiviva TaxID=1510459 RepID=A0A839UNN7_9GAMM|nr:Sua5/YciO/YrdC/YwlC family protein [Simiduia aestuariiviva]MBB3169804.1 L-threonylcarbamoyladenylate synthase [Simiduia aestuariiviva]
MMNPWLDHPDIHHAVAALKDGGVIAYPTEGVWGLGCLPENEAAVLRILALKQRPVEKGLILVAARQDQVMPWLAPVTEAAQRQLAASWPGPNTWLIPHNGSVPPWITGQHPKLAVRVSDHPVVQALCELTASALVSTSANPQGLPAAMDAAEVTAYFSMGIDALAPGAVGARGRPSLIRDLETGAEIRA